MQNVPLRIKIIVVIYFFETDGQNKQVSENRVCVCMCGVYVNDVYLIWNTIVLWLLTRSFFVFFLWVEKITC